jgi:hypothetical protein
VGPPSISAMKRILIVYQPERIPATFAMVAASIIRRRQHLELGLPDPFAIPTASLSSRAVSRSSTPIAGQSAVSVQLEKANAQQELNKSLLRLTFLLQSSTCESSLMGE